jgi:glyoxylase-like metal-dependent hydrolase (beta-lactamase superfamily II)
MDYQLDVLPVGPLQMNAVLLTGKGPEGNEAVLIDPGEEAERLLRIIAGSDCVLKGLWATHGHFDHVGSAAAIQEVHDLPLLCHADDLPLIQEMPAIQKAYGFFATALPRCQADLGDGTTLPFAGGSIEVRHVPGHSPGQVMFVLPPSGNSGPGCAIVGDCLFAGSIGRTDLPGGDFDTLEKSIRERIYTLPDDTRVVSGHGPDTTVGREKASNPFVRG